MVQFAILRYSVYHTMTRYAHWNNIKPIFIGIAFVVMVLLCCFTTRTPKIGGWFYFSRHYAIGYGVPGTMFNGVFKILLFSSEFTFLVLSVFSCVNCAFLGFIKSLSTIPSHFLSLLGVEVFFASQFMRQFAFYSLRISFSVGVGAFFTIVVMPIFIKFVFIEFRKWFDLFATSALFCYDCFRHGFFLIKKLCLEPVVRHNLTVGSFHYTIEKRGVKCHLSQY